jgi:nucleoid DNA-binding protein
MAAKKKTAKRAATKKKGAAKKSVAKKATAVKSMSSVKQAMNKTALYAAISEMTEVAKKDVSKVFDALTNVLEAHIKKNAAGHFVLPGLFKVKTVRKPATKARKGINPFTGEETVFKAKPARTVVKVQALKKVKDMAA